VADDKPADPKLHHVGIVVSNIENEVERLAGLFGASWNTKIFHDPLQEVRVTFLRGAYPGEALIELVEPAGEKSPVQSFLHKGGGFHHMCYEVSDLDAQLRDMRARGHAVVRPPLPAVAFGNRRISWVLARPRVLLEFLAREGEESQ
jgi:methylmalonyl-CoA/ethylmalonyl-CoA epimerase